MEKIENANRSVQNFEYGDYCEIKPLFGNTKPFDDYFNDDLDYYYDEKDFYDYDDHPENDYTLDEGLSAHH